MGKKKRTTSSLLTASASSHDDHHKNPSSLLQYPAFANVSSSIVGNNPIDMLPLPDVNVESIVSFFEDYEHKVQSIVSKRAKKKKHQSKKKISILKYHHQIGLCKKIDFILNNQSLFTYKIHFTKRLQCALFSLLILLEQDHMEHIVLKLLLVLFTISTDKEISVAKLPQHDGIKLQVMLLEYCCRRGNWEGEFLRKEAFENYTVQSITKKKNLDDLHYSCYYRSATMFSSNQLPQYLYTISMNTIHWLRDKKMTSNDINDKDMIQRFLNVIQYFFYQANNLYFVDLLVNVLMEWYINFVLVNECVKESVFLYPMLWQMIEVILTEKGLQIFENIAAKLSVVIDYIALISKQKTVSTIANYCNNNNLYRIYFMTYVQYIKLFRLGEMQHCPNKSTSNYSYDLLRFSLVFDTLCYYPEFIQKISVLDELGEEVIDLCGFLKELVEFICVLQVASVSIKGKHDCTKACFMLLYHLMIIKPNCVSIVSEMKDLFPVLLQSMRDLLQLRAESEKDVYVDVASTLACLTGVLTAFTKELLDVPDWSSLIISTLEMIYEPQVCATAGLVTVIIQTYSVTNEFINSIFLPLFHSKLDMLLQCLNCEGYKVYEYKALLSLVEIILGHLRRSKGEAITNECIKGSFVSTIERCIPILLRLTEKWINHKTLLSRVVVILKSHIDVIEANDFTIFADIRFFANSFITLINSNLPPTLCIDICHITLTLVTYCDTYLATLTNLPTFLSGVAYAMEVYLDTKPIVFSLFQLLYQCSGCADAFLRCISTKLFINVLQHSSQHQNVVEWVESLYEYLFDNKKPSSSDKLKFSMLLCEIINRYYGNHNQLPFGICNLLLRVGESLDELINATVADKFWNTGMQILNSSASDRDTVFIAIQMLKMFVGTSEDEDIHMHVITTLIMQAKEYLETDLLIAEQLLEYLCLLVNVSDELTASLQVEISFFCNFIIYNNPNERLMNAMVRLVNNICCKGVDVFDYKHIPACYGEMMLAVMQSPIDKSTAIITGLSSWLNYTTLDCIFPKDCNYINYIVNMFPLVVGESNVVLGSMCHIVATILDDKLERGKIAYPQKFVPQLIQAMPLPQNNNESLDNWIICFCRILLNLMEQEYDTARAVRLWILKNESLRSVFQTRMVTYIRHYKKHASMIKLLCEVLSSLNMDSVDIYHVTNINGFCDLLIQSVRHHSERNDVVRVLCSTVQMFLCSNPAIKVKFVKIANCFDVVTNVIVKHYCGDFVMMEISVKLLTTLIEDSVESLKRFLGLGTNQQPINTLLTVLKPRNAAMSNRTLPFDYMIMVFIVDTVLEGLLKLIANLQNANDVLKLLIVMTDVASIYREHTSFPITKVCESIATVLRDEKRLALIHCTSAKCQTFGSGVVGLLRAYSTNDTVVAVVGECLWRIMSDSPSKMFSADDNVCDELISTLALCNQPDAVHNICCALKAFIMQDESMKEAFQHNQSFRELLHTLVARYVGNSCVLLPLLQLHDLLNLPIAPMLVVDLLRVDIGNIVSGESKTLESFVIPLWQTTLRRITTQWSEMDLLQLARIANIGKGLIIALHQELSKCNLNISSIDTILHLLHLVIQYCNNLDFTSELPALFETLLGTRVNLSTRLHVIRLIPMAYYYNANMNDLIVKWFECAYEVPHIIPSVLLSIQAPTALIPIETILSLLFSNQRESDHMPYWSHMVMKHLQRANSILLEHDFIILHYSLKGFDVDTFLRKDMATNSTSTKKTNNRLFLIAMEKGIIPFIENLVSKVHVVTNEVIAEHLCGVVYWLQSKWSHHITIPVSLWKLVSELMELHIGNMSLVEIGCGFLSSIAQRWNVPKDCSMFIDCSWKVLMMIMKEYVYDDVIFNEAIQLMERILAEMMKSDEDRNLLISSINSLKHCQEAFVEYATICGQCAADIPFATLQCMLRMMSQLECHLLRYRSVLMDPTLQYKSTLVTICNVYIAFKSQELNCFQFVTLFINFTTSKEIDDVINVEALIHSQQAIKDLIVIAETEVFRTNKSHSSFDIVRFVQFLVRCILSRKELCLVFGKLCELIIQAFQQPSFLNAKFLTMASLQLLLLLTEENSNLTRLQSMENAFVGLNMLLESLKDSEYGKKVSSKIYELMQKLVSKYHVIKPTKEALDFIIHHAIRASEENAKAAEADDAEVFYNGIQCLHHIISSNELMRNLSRADVLAYYRFNIYCKVVKQHYKNNPIFLEQMDHIMWALTPLLVQCKELKSKRPIRFTMMDLDKSEGYHLPLTGVHANQDGVEFMEQIFDTISVEKVLTWMMTSLSQQISYRCDSYASSVPTRIATLHQLLKSLHSFTMVSTSAKACFNRINVCNTIECVERVMAFVFHSFDGSLLATGLEVIDMLSSKWLLTTNAHFNTLSNTSNDNIRQIKITALELMQRLHNDPKDTNNVVLITQLSRFLNKVNHVITKACVDNIPVKIDTSIYFKVIVKYQDNAKVIVIISNLLTSSLFASKQQHSALKLLLPDAWLPCLLSIIERNQMTPSVISVLLHTMNDILRHRVQPEIYQQMLRDDLELLIEILQYHQFNNEVVSALCPILFYALTRSSGTTSATVNDDCGDTLRILLMEMETYFLQQDTSVSVHLDLLSNIRDLLRLLPKEPSTTVTEVASSSTHDTTMNKMAMANDLENVRTININVLKATWKGCMNVVVKRLNHDSETEEMYTKLVSITPKHTTASSYQEKELLANMRHPKIISLIGISSSIPNVNESLKHEQCDGIVLEYLEKGDLRKLLNEEHSSLSLQCKLRIALDICDGMRFLHASNVIHGELQSMNVLIDAQYRAKISGFGNERLRQIIKAPMKFDVNNLVNRSRDVYDFAVIVWEMETGKVAWTEKVSKQAKLTLTAKEAKACSYGVSKLLDSCMVASTDVMKRPSFAQLYETIHELLVKETKRIEDKAREVPDGFLCPITQDIMKDPVILGAEGHSYERSEIVKWLKKSTLSPLTGAELSESEKTNLIDNYALKSAIESFLSKQQEAL